MLSVKIMLDKGAIKPTRAHRQDAGVDLYATKKKILFPFCSAFFDTGVHIEIPDDYCGMIKSKSGLNVKHGIISEGVIDAGYTGSIGVKLYNLSFKPYVIHEGDKISQLVIMPIETPALIVSDKFDRSERGDGGFGSTGR